MGRAEQKATIVGSLLGGLAGAGVLWLAVAPLYLRYMALVMGIGPGSRTRGVVAFLIFAAVFGGAFGAFVSRYAAPIATGMMGVARSNSTTRSLAAPFFRRAPLTTTTTLVGLVYGLILGVLVGQILVPLLVVGASPFSFELSGTDSGILLGFVTFGAVTGLGYGLSREDRLPAVGTGVGGLLGNEKKAVVLGPLVGGLAGGAVLYVLVPGHLASLALVTGVRPTAGAAVGVFLALAFVLGQGFVLTAARTVSRGPGYVRGVTSAGFAYGVVLAVALGMLAIPHYATRTVGSPVGVPNTNLAVIVGYLVYGTSLGAAYGSVRQRGHVLSGVVREHRDAVVFSSLVGGFLGGGIVYQAAGQGQMLFYGALVGYAGSIPRSWAVWMATTFLLGLFYVRFVRPRDTSGTYIWKSTRRGAFFGLSAGLFVGATLVPAIVGATTEFRIAVPSLDPMLLLGYTVFGAVVGAGYGASVEEEGLAVGADRTKGVVFGSLLGGLVGGLIIHHVAGPVHIQLVGSFVGVAGSVAKSWAVWLLLCLVFGVGFARILSRSLDAYIDSLVEKTEANPDLRAVLGPALDGAPVTTTASWLGLTYGATLGVIVGLLLVPMFVTIAVPAYVVPYPSTDLGVLLGYAVFGLFLGAGYGTMVEF